MISLLQQRRSIRKFTSRPVEPEKIRKLLTAALLAPSSMGKKPVEIVVVEDRASIRQLEACKKSGTRPLETAPLALAVIADASRSDVWVEDAAIVAILLQLEAEQLGLASTWVQMRLRENAAGESSEEAVRQVLGVPRHYGVLCVVAIGYRDEHKEPRREEDLDFSKVHREQFGI
jgi:nitroreductase